MKLSIVVPVYNVETFLDECMESILAQTFKDFELIIVDDGSTDSSGELCDKWAARDNRINVYHRENGGLMSAWKFGVTKAKGEYIGFVDSDDWIDKNMYQRMLEIADEQKADVVCVALTYEYNGKEISQERLNLKPGFYSEKEIKKEIYPYLLISERFKTRGLSPNRVTKIFRRDVLCSVLDDCDERVSIGEDLLTTFSFLQKAKSIYIIGDFYPYHYRINHTSMIQTFNKNKYEKIEFLKNTMLHVNKKYDVFDFTEQIHTDYIDLYLRQLEQEILLNKDYGLLKKSIKESFFTAGIQQSLAICNQKMMNKKNKLYLFLLKHRMIRTLIVIRKIKGRN